LDKGRKEISVNAFYWAVEVIFKDAKEKK